MSPTDARPVLLVLASTYPRWKDDHEPGFVHELAKRLTGRFRVLALVPHSLGAREREVLEGVEVIRYRYAPDGWETLVNDGGIVANLRRARWKLLLVPGFALIQMWQAWRIVRQEGVDVIHAHWLIPQGLIAALVQRVAGNKVPFVVTSHGADLHALHGRVLDRLKRFVADRAAAVTVVSGAMRSKLLALGVSHGEVSVLPMGVDMRERFRLDVSVQRSSRELLFVGRLVEKKGLRHLLEAMPQVLRRIPDARLTIAGFGPEEAALKALCDRLGLGHVVRFLGAVPQADLPALYRRAALFVAPFIRARSGDEEGLGLVLVEAISCGCPLLVGDVPAVADVLGVDFGGMVVNPRDTENLAARIIDVLVHPEAAQTRAGHLRETVGTRFDWSAVSAQYSDLLAKVI